MQRGAQGGIRTGRGGALWQAVLQALPVGSQDTRKIDRRALVEAYKQGAGAMEDPQPYLRVLTGGLAGAVVLLADGETVLGRDVTCHVRLDDDGVSRRHMVLRLDAGLVEAQDLGSTNGTFCNSEKLAEPRVLADGDRLQLGVGVIMSYHINEALEVAVQQRVHEAAIRDPLTGCYNRKHLMDSMATEMTYAKRHVQPLGVALVDLDHFKAVNDQHGHLVGDEVLKDAARRLRVMVRSGDLLARYGGEEFVLLLRQVRLEDATRAVERFRRATCQVCVEVNGIQVSVTASAGVTVVDPSYDITALEALRRADEALYAAKRGGRNRVVSWPVADVIG